MSVRGRLLLLLTAVAVLGAAVGTLAWARSDPERFDQALERALQRPEASPSGLPVPPPIDPAPAPTVGSEPPPAVPAVPPPSPAPLKPPDTALATRLRELLADPALAGLPIGVSVVDEQGQPVFSSEQGSTPLLPASTQKLVTAAAALATFGPQHRFTTAAGTTAPPAPDGTVLGDLVLVGGGDPVLASPIFDDSVEPERPSTPLAVLADRVAASGIRRVSGAVVGDASSWADEPLPTGWLPRYLTGLDGVRASPLTVDAGRVLGIDGGRVVGRAADDPAAQAAAQLHGLLAERGVVVEAGWRSSRTPVGVAVELARVESPPLVDLTRWAVQESDNALADGLFRAVGAARGTPTWVGSAQASIAVLEPLGLDWAGAVLADGSGLSRDDRMPPSLLALLDLQMSRSSLGVEWDSVMAVTGQSGTLSRRLVDTIAAGRVRGKTGTLSDVRALSASAVGPTGERYVFAIVANALVTTDALTRVRALTDQVVLALVEDLYGCVRVEVTAPEPAASDPAAPDPDPTAPPTPPAVELRCEAA